MSIARLLFAALLAWAALLSRAAGAEALLVIANSSVQVPAPMKLDKLAAIYLLRITTWPDGRRIVPVNREALSTARKKFASEVLGEDNASLAVYWSEMHYKGKQPPVVQESEQSMLAFVQRVPGAIGYISASTAPDGVHVIAHVP